MTALTNPNLALLLLLAGIFLIYAEFNRPGTVILGSLGALAIMLAIFGLSHLTLHPTLPILGLTILLAELRFSTRNVLAIAGTILLAAGLVRMTPGVRVPTAVLTAVLFAAVTLWLGRIALQARRNKFVPGSMPWTERPHIDPTR